MRILYLIALLMFSNLTISCAQTSEKERLHQNKIKEGIIKKENDIDWYLKKKNKDVDIAQKRYDEAFNSKSRKSTLKMIKAELDELIAFRDNLINRKNELKLPLKTFEFQSEPKLLMLKFFEIFKTKNLILLKNISDPYTEIQGDLDRIGYLDIYPKKEQEYYCEIFSTGEIIKEKEKSKDIAEFEIRYGKNQELTTSIKLVKRMDVWYLYSY